MIELAADLKAQVQEFFNTTYTAHVLNREPLGFRMSDGYAVCSYRDGCAVGKLLTSEEIAAIPLDGDGDEAVGGVFTLYDEVNITSFGKEHLEFLSRMQFAHDQATRYIAIVAEYSDGTTYLQPDVLMTKSKKGRWYVARRNYKVVAKLYDLTIPS